MKKRLLTMIFAFAALASWAQTVEAPTFTFEGDNLVMTTGTATASVFYGIADLTDLQDATITATTNSLIQCNTYYDQPVEVKHNVIIKAVALAENGGTTISSDTTTLVYGYTSWVTLQTAVTRGDEVYARANGDTRVDASLLSQLQWAVDEGKMISSDRVNIPFQEADHFAEEINMACDQIEAIIGTATTAEPYAVLSADGLTVTLYYDDQKTARGGIEINTQSWDIENGAVPPYGGITKAVFDASFANYQPTSTAYWFQGCRNMTTVEGMEYLNTSNVTNMWAMFDWCSSLQSIDLSHMDTSNAVYLAYMFNGCSSLLSLDVSGFNTENATDIGAMFRYCSKLTTVDVSHFNTSKVTSFWGLFAECTSLTSLNVSNFDTSSAENMAYIFYNCQLLQSLDVSHFNTSNATNMFGLFGRCSSLTNLDLSGFNTAKVTDMSNMFAYCNALTSLDVSGFNTENVTNMASMFAYCNVLPSLNVSNFNTANVTNMSYMFAGSFTLNNLDLSGFNTANVTDMTCMFDACYGLYNLNLSGFNTANVTNMSHMFAGCARLTSLDVSGFLTANVTNMSSLFYNCLALRSLDLSSFNTANVTDFGDFVSNCSSLAAIQAGSAAIPDSVYAQVGNPNLLVYVNDASLAPKGVQNVVINGTAPEIILTDVESGNNNWYCPQPFTAQKISYTRNFQQQTQIGVSRGWETIALPFDVQTIAAEDSRIITPFGDYTSPYNFWLRRLTHNGLQSAQQIEANTPYLISMPNSTEYPEEYKLAGKVTFSAENASVPESNLVIDESSDIFFSPTYERMEAQQYIYAINVGEERGGHPEGSVFEQNYREVRPFEAYTKHLTGPSRFITLDDLDEGFATSIEELKNGKIEELKSDQWYDLNGRRVLRPSKGLFINNGRKVMMK